MLPGLNNAYDNELIRSGMPEVLCLSLEHGGAVSSEVRAAGLSRLSLHLRTGLRHPPNAPNLDWGYI